MNFKKITIDGENILRKGIHYTSVDWLKLAVGETSKNFEGLHGRIVSPTLVRNRIITIEGIIDRMDDEDEFEKFSHLERIFSLQGNTSQLEEKELNIIDQFDREWKIFVKIKTPLEYDEGDNNLKGSHWKWRVVLESTTLPYYTSKNITSIHGRNGRYGGIKFGMSLGSTWNTHSNELVVDTGNISVPVSIKIIAKNTIISPLKIINTTDKSIFMADISAVDGDEIIIDSENFSITKNGINTTGSRIRGSVWPQAKGRVRFIISDKSEQIEQNMTTEITFSKILL